MYRNKILACEIVFTDKKADSDAIAKLTKKYSWCHHVTLDRICRSLVLLVTRVTNRGKLCSKLNEKLLIRKLKNDLYWLENEQQQI